MDYLFSIIAYKASRILRTDLRRVVEARTAALSQVVRTLAVTTEATLTAATTAVMTTVIPT